MRRGRTGTMPIGGPGRWLHRLPIPLLAIGALAMSGAFIHQMREGGAGHGAPSARQHMLPGLTLANAQPPGSGLVVTSIRSRSAAARQGILVGDDIVAIDGSPVHSLDQASRYLVEKPRPRIVVALVHDDQMRWVTLDRSGL